MVRLTIITLGCTSMYMYVHYLLYVGLTLATVVSLPVNDNHTCSEAKRLSFQLFSLRENVVFKKLGVYGRRRLRKSMASSNTTQKPVEPTSHPVNNKSHSPPLLNDATVLPDLPKPADKEDNVKSVTFDELPAPSSINSR